MARNHANNGRIYRAVITRVFQDRSGTFVTTCGPYDARHVAKARITAAENDAEASCGKHRNPAYAHSAEGHIESAEVVWMRESAGE